MSLGWIRRASRVIAAILLMTSMLQLPHPSLDDEGCAAPSAERHDESKHVFTSVGQIPHQDHCAICHWLRWMNPVFSPGPSVIVDLTARSEVAAFTAGVLRSPSADRLPPRAPPAL
jgi:desulfoferrodoxin (superoxide reductase-like protein)